MVQKKGMGFRKLRKRGGFVKVDDLKRISKNRRWNYLGFAIEDLRFLEVGIKDEVSTFESIFKMVHAHVCQHCIM